MEQYEETPVDYNADIAGNGTWLNIIMNRREK